MKPWRTVKRWPGLAVAGVIGVTVLAGSIIAQQKDARTINRLWRERILAEGGSDENNHGIREPVLSTLTGRDIRVPYSKQIAPDGTQANVLSLDVRMAEGALSATGHIITRVSNPHKDLHSALSRLYNDARFLHRVNKEAAEEALDILLGRTEGAIYDGFPLLNFNRWRHPGVHAAHFPPGSIPGEYKMKEIRPVLDETGRQLMVPSWKGNGEMVRVWQVDINMFWYGQQFDADTFMVKIPLEVGPQSDDVLRVNYTIYSLIEEDFAPTTVLRDIQAGVRDDGIPNRGGSVRFPFKGYDTVWVRIQPNTVTRITVQFPAIRFFRGIYTWGWNVHPPRIHFTEFQFQIRNAHTGEIDWDWRGQSYVVRNRLLSLEGIGEAAPEKKAYRVARRALDDDATAEEILDMLTVEDPVNPLVPRPVFGTWIDLMENQRQLPPEAIDMLADELGLSDRDEALEEALQRYDFITVYLNNEMYGLGPHGATIRFWEQGDRMTVKLINLDNHTHYFRNVGFGPQLHNDLSLHADDGIFSFEIMNFKPLYGAPKVAEMQWRAGWGFRPHYGVIQQADVFPRSSDRQRLKPYRAPGFEIVNGQYRFTGQQVTYYGYQFQHRRGDFPFNPPPFIIGTRSDPAPSGLSDLATGEPRPGLVIGQVTEGWGVAKMCPDDPWPGFCQQDISSAHPLGLKNRDTDGDGVNDALLFPPFLRNPNQTDPGAGDIIPPTPAWEPFLFLNPANGTIYLDPDDRSEFDAQGNPRLTYWADLTYAHGRPILAGQSIDVHTEMPRSAGQLFYQFDDLFHDNAIFSPHPINAARGR